MIELKEVSYRYADGTLALDQVSLKIEENQIIYLIGESGSGKSTLLKILQGRLKVTSGSVHLMGINLLDLKATGLLRYRQRLGPIFQEFRLIDGLTAYQNVLIGAEVLSHKPLEPLNEMAVKCLREVGLGEKIYKNVEALSYGERQRVSIARAMIRNPELIIADEPTGNLDEVNALSILKILTGLNRTVIIATHAKHLIQALPSGRIIQVKGGKLYE